MMSSCLDVNLASGVMCDARMCKLDLIIIPIWHRFGLLLLVFGFGISIYLMKFHILLATLSSASPSNFQLYLWNVLNLLCLVTRNIIVISYHRRNFEGLFSEKACRLGRC